MTGWSFVGIVVAGVVAWLLFSGFFKAWRRYRGTRLITCPENHETAAVKVDALQAGKWMAVAGETHLRLKACSRWPEMEDCGQECLRQIEDAPETCLMRNIVTQWYEGKDCVYCAKPIGEIVWHERPPALRAPNGRSRTWKEVKPEELPDFFATHKAVCWPCHIRESFRREHPDLVIERPRPAEPHPIMPPSVAVY